VAYRTLIHLFTDIHPTYLSLYLCLSVCIMLLAPKLSMRVHPFMLNALLYLCFIFLLALGAKTPILALVLILAHYAWAHRGELRRYRLLFAGLILTAAAACIFIPFIGQRMGEMVQYFKAKEQGNLTDNSVLARKAIWDMDIALVKQHWLSGIGPGRVQPVMEAESAARGIPTAYHDPHNEYVYQWLCFGIAGIVIFVATLLMHFRQSIRAGDHLYLYLLILFCATFFTETVLSLQRGILLYSVFTALLFYYGSDNGKLRANELQSEGKSL
jgi:O-antigen ligase